MKLYCSVCNKFVAEIQSGSHIRKDSVMLCSKCYERLKLADKMAEIARAGAKAGAYPEFFNEIFGGKK